MALYPILNNFPFTKKKQLAREYSFREKGAAKLIYNIQALFKSKKQGQIS